MNSLEKFIPYALAGIVFMLLYMRSKSRSKKVLEVNSSHYEIFKKRQWKQLLYTLVALLILVPTIAFLLQYLSKAIYSNDEQSFIMVSSLKLYVLPAFSLGLLFAVYIGGFFATRGLNAEEIKGYKALSQKSLLFAVFPRPMTVVFLSLIFLFLSYTYIPRRIEVYPTHLHITKEMGKNDTIIRKRDLHFFNLEDQRSVLYIHQRDSIVLENYVRLK